MSISTLLMAFGGIGVLLLGMRLISEGLKSAAGTGLSAFLERSTQTQFRAAFTGFGITAVVQSSGAVIVSTLGFTNAGILSLRQAAWVVFGSNLGTTMKAWLVALVGLNINIEAFALPIISFGMFFSIFFNRHTLSHLGTALAGFGILFLGLAIMRDAFGDVASVVPIDQLNAAGFWGILLAILIGATLTALMQSSSASIAIIITASVTGVLTPILGAALVIGANLGVTSTTLLASIGATTNAKRLALIHLFEKGFTACIAVLLLVPMAWMIELFAGSDGRNNISMGLAFFHTFFNLLSLFLMTFVARYVIRFAEKRIKQPELMSEKPRFIDDTVLEIPALGTAAMQEELKRVYKQLLSRARLICMMPENQADEQQTYINTNKLLNHINVFAEKLGKNHLAGLSETFINLNLVSQELLHLREHLYDIQNTDAKLLEQVLNTELQAIAHTAFTVSSLKQLNYVERLQLIQEFQHTRLTLRHDYVKASHEGKVQLTEVPKRLQVLEQLETILKSNISIANILYPESGATSAQPTQEAY